MFAIPLLLTPCLTSPMLRPSRPVAFPQVSSMISAHSDIRDMPLTCMFLTSGTGFRREKFPHF
jgi:hypothetical protein